MPPSKKSPYLRWLLLCAIPVAWIVFGQIGWLDFLENKSIDWRFRIRGEREAPVKIVYVDVDSQSIADMGSLPWDRAYFETTARALLTAGKAKAIGIDFVFSENGRVDLLDEARFQRGTQQFAAFLSPGTGAVPPVVLAASYAAAQARDVNHQLIVRELPRVRGGGVAADKVEPPELPEFRVGNLLYNAPRTGLIDSIDGGTRMVPLFAQVGEKIWFHMAVELARLHWDLPASAVRVSSDHLEIIGAAGEVKASLALIDGQNLEVNWFSKWESAEKNPRVSFSRALVAAQMVASEKEEERAAAAVFFKQFEDAIVLIGPVDQLLQDLAPTSLDAQPVPKVGIHGNLLKTIVSGRQLRHPSAWLTALLTLGLTVAVCGLAVAGGRYGAVRKVVAGLICVGYVLVSQVAFSSGEWVMPLVMPLGAMFTTSFAGVVWQLVVEERQKSRIKGMFGAYVSPELVNRMVDSNEEPRLGGEEAQITAFFSDIQDFTTFAEGLPPTRLVELMNEYLTACTDIITEHGGTLDKYIGDAVVAMFGAPVPLSDHAYRACVAALRVQLKQNELRAQWAAETGKWPEEVLRMQTRIGLNSGAAVVGNMGSLIRFNYTMMGDTVNLAARLEAGARTYGVNTLVSESTRRACERAGDECVFRFLDRIVVKGRAQPVSIHEIVGLRSQLTPEVKAGLEHFGAGVEKYLAQDWSGAQACFQKAAACEVAQEGALTPARVYLQRCEWMKNHPPGPSWDGVFVMLTK